MSLRDNLDLSTPMGRFTAQLLGAMAEFEKELIREEFRPALTGGRTNCKSEDGLRRRGATDAQGWEGKRVNVDLAKITALREQVHSWRAIASELGIGEGTVRRAAQSC